MTIADTPPPPTLDLAPEPKARTSRRPKARYDEVVVAGNGLGAITFAARMARHPAYRGRVTIVAPPVRQSRRLIAGCSLRARAADVAAESLGVDTATLLSTVTDGQAGPPVSARQTTGMATPTGGDRWRLERTGPWQGGPAGLDRPLMYGVRNFALIGAMLELLREADLGVTEVEERVTDADDLRRHARREHSLLVNATPNGGLLGAPTPPPPRWCLAVQAPFAVRDTGLQRPFEPGVTYAPLVRRAGTIDVGYFTPWADPLTPSATWYGINARPWRHGPGPATEPELDALTEELFGIADAGGLEVVDPDETLARAVIPASPWTAPPPSPPGTLELKRGYGTGVPSYYADGMIGAIEGSAAAADAVLHGGDPDRALQRATAPYRAFNAAWWLQAEHLAGVVDVLLRRAPIPLAMYLPHTAQWRYWASRRAW